MNCPLCQAPRAADEARCRSCAAPLPGAVLAARYAISELLGKGGMGAVYKAWDRKLEQAVAVKVLLSEALSVDRIARRFRREIKLARRVRHPNVCAIHEYGEADSLRYIVMEWVDGVDLGRAIRDKGRMPVDEALGVLGQIAEALQAMHDAGILHRDIKPSNVMRDGRGVVRLMDFGVAKPVLDDESATTIGLLVGTPEYMSPEQAQGERLDFRSDVYALGVLAFELLTAVSPFRARTPIKTLLKVLHDPPPLETRLASHVPPALRQVLRRAMAKDPEARFASVRELLAALRQPMPLGVTAPAAPVIGPSFDEGKTAMRPAPAPTERISPVRTPRQAQSFLDAGTECLRGLDVIGAREAFEKAVFLDPGLARAHAGLAEALSSLGHDAAAQEAARKALETVGALTAEERRLVEARCRSAIREWKRAVEAYAALYEDYPTEVEYGLGLARAQLDGEGAAPALATLQKLQQLGGGRGDDPRLDLLLAEAADALSDWPRQREAAGRAAKRAAAYGLERLSALASVEEANARRNAGEFEVAETAFEEAQRALEALGDKAAAARAVQALARSNLERGKLTRARLLYEGALATHKEEGDRRGASLALAGIARVALLRGDLVEAARFCSEALATLRRTGPPVSASRVTADLAEVVLRQGDLAAAGRLLDEAVAALRAAGERQRLAGALLCAAEVSSRQGNLVRARAACEEALALAKAIGDRSTTARALERQALLAAAGGEHTAPGAMLEEAVREATAGGAGLALHQCRLSLGSLLLETGNPAEAERLARAALEAFGEESCRDAAARAQALLAEAMLGQGRTERAGHVCRLALAACERSADPAARLQVTLAAARQRVAMGRPKDALASHEVVLADLVRRGWYAEQLAVRLFLGEIEIASDNVQAGKKRLAALEVEAAGRGFLHVASRARLAVAV